MPNPIFRIYADGVDVSDRISGAGIALSINDGDGLKADTAQITIDNATGTVVPPPKGATLRIVGGYEDRMRDFGLFIVNGRSFVGFPRRIEINAKSVEALKLAKQREPKAYPAKDFPTYGDIFAHIASVIGVTLHISASIKAIRNVYKAQSEEDGLEFTTRIGEKLNASVTVKAGNLVVTEKGSGKSASGAKLDRIQIAAGLNLLSFSVNDTDEPKHSDVEATFYDRDKNERSTVKVGTTMDGPKFLIRTPFQNKEEAEQAAKAKSKKLKRMQGSASFTIEGDPFAQAEAWADVSGCGAGVDGEWRVSSVSHNFTSDGPYVTTIQSDVPTGEAE